MNTTLNVGLNLNPYKKNQQAGSTQSLPKDNLLSGNKSLTTDTINFSSNKNVIHNNRLSFTGIVPAQKEIDAYLDDYAGYKKIADMNNNVLASFVDPANAREISRIGEKSGKTREQLLGEVSDNMVMAYNQLKDSNVIVVNGIKPAKVDFLDNNKYTQVKNIYLNLLDRPETFKRVAFDAEDHQLETILSEEDIEEHTRDFKHIVNDILPEILNSKTLVLSNSANLKDILSDEVVQGIIIDKLYEEISGNNEEEKSLENLNIAEKKMHTAMHILHDIDSKFNITTVSEVPGRFYDPLAKEGLKPKENYNPKYFNLRQEPKNFYEAKFLNNAAKDIKSYNPETTIIVTPKSAANDIIEKVKTINKDYLFIEDWLYKYSLGDQKAKDEVLEKLNKAADGKFVSEFKSIANELDNYLNNYIQVYDTENPENNSKLTGMMKQFGKVNSMSDISRGYFLGIGEDSRELVKMLLSLGILIEIAEKASDATGITAIENIANTIASSTDSIASASSNYLHWKNELGDQAAKDNFKQAITNILTFSLPTSLFRLSPKDSSIKHLLFRNLSAVDAYSGTVETLSDYSKKLKELMQKEIKNPPAEIKDDPDKLAKWKMNETWKAFTAHSLNRGQVIGLLASQPYALMVNPLMQLGGPSRAILIALAGTLECWVSSFYLLLDNSNWHKFSNQLKKDMVENNNINITPEEFIKLRKSALSKAVESSTGQAGLSAVVKASKHIPADTSAKVKKAYNSIANVVDKTVARHVSTLLMKYLDKKYNKMSEEERENLDHGHHH